MDSTVPASFGWVGLLASSSIGSTIRVNPRQSGRLGTHASPPPPPCLTASGPSAHGPPPQFSLFPSPPAQFPRPPPTPPLILRTVLLLLLLITPTHPPPSRRPTCVPPQTHRMLRHRHGGHGPSRGGGADIYRGRWRVGAGDARAGRLEAGVPARSEGTLHHYWSHSTIRLRSEVAATPPLCRPTCVSVLATYNSSNSSAAASLHIPCGPLPSMRPSSVGEFLLLPTVNLWHNDILSLW